MSVAHDVLDLARWAPSGDNSQPWRFVLRSEREFDVVGYDTSADVVYDLDGFASHLAHGILLETIAIAATRFGCRARVALPVAGAPSPLVYRVTLDAEAAVNEDPLCAAIRERAVQRLPMRPRRLAPVERAALSHAAAPYRIEWFESFAARHRVAALCAQNARIRLTIPEAYRVHRSVIAWHTTESYDRLPDAALGADPLLLAVMRRTMTSWQRVALANRLGGTLVPRLALDYLPGLMSSACLALIAPQRPQSLADRIDAGRAVQRLWLCATSLGLQMQPQYTPLVFARYAREERAFTTFAGASAAARRINTKLEALLGIDAAHDTTWLARIGPKRRLRGRSLRLPLSQLIVETPPSELPPLADPPR